MSLAILFETSHEYENYIGCEIPCQPPIFVKEFRLFLPRERSFSPKGAEKILHQAFRIIPQHPFRDLKLVI